MKNAVINQTAAMAEAATFAIESVLSAHPKLSLKRLCDEAGLCYQYIFKAGKQPIEGIPYEASAINYGAIQKIIDKKGIDLASFDWSAIEASIKVFEPISKAADFEIHSVFKLRADDKRYIVLYKNENYVCFISMAGEATTAPRVMNWDTFLHQSPRIISDNAE